MRSFDRTMPEELNRVLTDHMSELLLCASDDGRREPARESAPGAIEVVGDVMMDVASPASRRRAPTEPPPPPTDWSQAPTCCSPRTGPATSTIPTRLRRSSM